MKPSNTSTEDRMMTRLQSANGESGSTDTDQEGRPFIPPPPPPPTQASNSSSQSSGRTSDSVSASNQASGRSIDMGNVSTQTGVRAAVNLTNAVLTTQQQYAQPPAPRVTVHLQPYNGLTSPLQWWMTFMSYVSLYSLTDRQTLDNFSFNTMELYN